MAAVTGYCLKCKKKVEIKDAQQITMKNGKPATTGSCPTCGTKIYKIGSRVYLSVLEPPRAGPLAGLFYAQSNPGV